MLLKSAHMAFNPREFTAFKTNGGKFPAPDTARIQRKNIGNPRIAFYRGPMPEQQLRSQRLGGS